MIFETHTKKWSQFLESISHTFIKIPVTLFKQAWAFFSTSTKKRKALTYCKSRLLPSRFSISAESEGFEPPEQLPVHRISSAARSTTPATFLKSGAKVVNYRYQYHFAEKKVEASMHQENGISATISDFLSS